MATNQTTPQPAWKRRKEFREPEILAAAVELLLEVGIDEMSMSDVADRANISEATVYKYFDSRKTLVARALQAALEPQIEALEKDFHLVKGCEARLRAFVLRSFQDIMARPNVHRAAHGKMRWSGDTRSALRDMHRRFAKLVTKILEGGVADGELRPDADLVLIGDMIFGAIESASWRTLLAGRKMTTSVEQFADVFTRQLLAGAGIAPATTAAPDLLDRLEGLVTRLEKRESRGG